MMLHMIEPQSMAIRAYLGLRAVFAALRKWLRQRRGGLFSERLRDVAVCGGFRLPGCRSIHALRRPAAEKRQGTKSREVGHRWGSGRYGDYMSAPSSGVDALLLECGWRIRTLVRS